MTIDFCLPVRNEEKILATNAGRLRDFLTAAVPAYSWRIVIIVNGSDDTSAALAAQLAAADSRFAAREVAVGGKGRALKTYFRESRADLLVFMDIDLAVSLGALPALLAPLLAETSDLTMGSRLLSASRTNRSVWRSLTSRAYNLLSRLVLGHRFSDLQCGFKAFRRGVFDGLQPWLEDEQWFFDTELVVAAVRQGYRVTEIPVDWQENRYDRRESKIRVFRDVWPFVRNLFRFRTRLARFRPEDNA